MVIRTHVLFLINPVDGYVQFETISSGGVSVGTICGGLHNSTRKSGRQSLLTPSPPSTADDTLIDGVQVFTGTRTMLTTPDFPR